MIGLSDHNVPALRREQVTVLFRNAPISILATVINASLLTALEWPAVPQSKLLAWLAGMWATAGLRAILSWAFRNKIHRSSGQADGRPPLYHGEAHRARIEDPPTHRRSGSLLPP